MPSIKASALAAILIAAVPAVAVAQNAAQNAAKAPAAGATAQNGPRRGGGDGGAAGNAGGGHSKREFLETYDANKDGKVSKEEFAARRGADHKGLDLNENGSVNELEYINEYTLRLDKELAARRAGQIRQAHVRFGVLDTNKDGVLSAEEFAASGDRMFSRLDTSGDGFVDTADTANSF
jgi:Ca2+-binding EF-hand superfamily protein